MNQSEYDKAFQVLRERGASHNKIIQEDPNLIIAVDTLIKGGTLVGQKTLEEDVIYYLNPEKVNTPLEVHSNWRVPQTPEEHLRRPTELKNGTTTTYPSDEQRLIEVRRQLELIKLNN